MKGTLYTPTTSIRNSAPQSNPFKFNHSNTQAVPYKAATKTTSYTTMKVPWTVTKCDRLFEEVTNDSDYYVRCWNCDAFLLLSEADMHSQSCTFQSEKSIKNEMRSISEQLNIQMAKIKKLIANKIQKTGNKKAWGGIITIIDAILPLNDITNTIILTIRKHIHAISKEITKYQGPYSGLLLINKVDVIAKQKHEYISNEYKKLYSNSMIKEIVKYSTSLPKNAQVNNSFNLPQSPIGSDRDLNNRSLEIEKGNLLKEESLKRLFYNKCNAVKKQLGKKSLGYWVESAPLYNYALKNNMPSEQWDKYIETELTTNVLKWLDTELLEKLEPKNPRLKCRNKETLNSIKESRSSMYDDENET